MFPEFALHVPFMFTECSLHVPCSLKSGLFLVPLLFFAPEGSLCAAGWCELENTKNLFLHAFDHMGEML
jgi:hypothetical protein